MRRGSATGLAGSTALELKFIGSGGQLREQALPLLFRIRSAQAMVAVGQPLKVIVATAQGIKGAALQSFRETVAENLISSNENSVLPVRYAPSAQFGCRSRLHHLGQ